MAESAPQRDAPDDKAFGIVAPTISLPKGGGAVRGIGEKFAANPVTGGGSFSVPIATSPGRGGFGPSLSLTYDSNSGQTAFGLGWNLTLSAVTRKTDKGLPRYEDVNDSDVFILAGVEDLVPALTQAANGDWSPESIPARVVDGATYAVRRYMPRIEGSFARIERWTNGDDPAECFWRVISRDNVTTWYGRTAESRIADQSDPRRIFSWLASLSYDGKGNAIVYRYKAEDSEGLDAAQLHERNRSAPSRSANRYLKRILYGNHSPFFPALLATKPWPMPAGADAPDGSADWFFELVLDYGEHQASTPTPTDAGSWQVRPDPFSSYRASYEVRTYRLCSRMLMFHHFAGEPEVGVDCLVRSTDFKYAPSDDTTDVRGTGPTRLLAVSQSGYLRQGAGYRKRSLPPVEFEYSKAEIDDVVREIDSTSLENLPYGADGANYQWVDLDGEGLSGILSEQGGAWWYKRNLSPLPEIAADGEATFAARFGTAERLRTVPSRSGLTRGEQLVDLAGDGKLDVVVFDNATAGFFERTADENWDSFTPFQSRANVASSDPNVRFVDLTGDGRADLFRTEDERFTWFPSLGEAGFGAAEHVRQALDEEDGPRLVFADGTQSVYLADLSGDGLADLVRIRNGDICYWPNLGYGRFGAKVTMDRAPWFDAPDQFDQKRVRLADIDGSGMTDIIYLGRNAVDVYFNESGNRWAAARRLTHAPAIDSLMSVMVVDLLGNGTACMVWSSPRPTDARHQMRYIDLMGGQKPDLLVLARNNLGGETEVEYAPSTKFYLADKRAGQPWITKLPFPVHVVERTAVRDKWRKTEFSSRFSYHHGYFDGVEREFRGFGRVEQTDVESFDTFAAGNVASPYITADQTLYQPPVKTITWFHTGAFFDRERVLSQFEAEYFPSWYLQAGGSSFREKARSEGRITDTELSAAEWREALRACKGMLLHKEMYELDTDSLHEYGAERRVRLFSAASHACEIRMVQPGARYSHPVFLVSETEAIAYQYDLDLRDPLAEPDPRVTHTLTLSVDAYGNPQQAISVSYPRRSTYGGPSLDAGQRALINRVQGELHVSYVESRYTNDAPGGVADADHYRLRVPCDVRSYELTGITPAAGEYFHVVELRNYQLSDELQDATPSDPSVPYQTVEELGYHELADDQSPQKRLIDHVRMLFWRNDLTGPLAFCTQEHLGLAYETYKLALTDDLLEAVFGPKLDDMVAAAQTARDRLDDSASSGYIHGADLTARFSPRVPAAQLAGQYWIRSGVAGFAADAATHFFLPERYTDSFGNVTTVVFDEKDLFIERATDPLGSRVEVVGYDFRVLAPREMKDINDNLSEVVFDVLGMVVATAAKGKGTEGDRLTGFTVAVTNPTSRDVALFCTATSVNEAAARAWLLSASTRFVYHFGEKRNAADVVVAWGARPSSACSFAREVHASAAGGGTTPLQVALQCADGAGNVLMNKTQAEPERADGPLRWIVEGKTVLNNKGNPVKQYEPYFTNDFGCEPIDEIGVTAVTYYDAIGRVIRTELADGALTRVEFSPWHSANFDANDTVLDAGNAWYASASSAGSPAAERRAAALAAAHADTPSITFFDSLGRDVISIVHNRAMIGGVPDDAQYVTYKKLDAEGRQLWLTDARGNRVIQAITPPMPAGQASDSVIGFVPCYDVAGNPLYRRSVDSGDRWTLPDAAGNPLVVWDFNEAQSDAGVVVAEERVLSSEYDASRRTIRHWIAVNGLVPRLVERFIHGESVAGAKARNLRGQTYRHYDPSGLLEVERVDFKGNQLEQQRRLVKDYRAAVIDWQVSPNSKLEIEAFTQRTEYDALNRTSRIYSWHRGTGSRVAVSEPHFNERGLLVSEDITVRATKTANGYTAATAYPKQTVIRSISYNAKGQKELVRYGNGTSTRYSYDPKRFRLTQLRTTRASFNPTFPSQPGALSDPRVLQNLFYTYDAAGNVVAIRDDAYEPAFFRNQQVAAVSEFTYDAVYRLLSATGRESTQASVGPIPLDLAAVAASFPVTTQAIRNYREEYTYDAVGNILEARHLASGNGSWTRHYEYAPSNNRLKRTWMGANVAGATIHQYDAHGNMRNLLPVTAGEWLRWDYRDMMRGLDLQGGGWASYNYDSTKQRTRKVISSASGVKQWERMYLGGMEIYRRYSGSNVVEEIESHAFVAAGERALLVDDILATTNQSQSLGPLFRFQYNNHLGSACVELDIGARIISYEEYHPYGSSSYRSSNAAIEAPRKRYRFHGLERDEESGFNYHHTRYYAPSVFRWTACDPLGHVQAQSPYQAFASNPISNMDDDGQLPSGVQYDVGRLADTLVDTSALEAPAVDLTPAPTPAGPSRAEKRFYQTGYLADKIEDAVGGLKQFGSVLVSRWKEKGMSAGQVGRATLWYFDPAINPKTRKPLTFFERHEMSQKTLMKAQALMMGFGPNTASWMSDSGSWTLRGVEGETGQNAFAIGGSLLATTGRVAALGQELKNFNAAGAEFRSAMQSHQQALGVYNAVTAGRRADEVVGIDRAIETMAWRGGWKLRPERIEYGAGRGLDVLYEGVGENATLWTHVEAKPPTATASKLRLLETSKAIGAYRQGGEAHLGFALENHIAMGGANSGLARDLLIQLRMGNVNTVASLKGGLLRLNYWGEVVKPF